MKSTTVHRTGRCLLLTGAAAAALVAATPALAQQQDSAIETAQYTMQVLTQSFDGQRERSQSQALAYARMRRGDESWIELDFGDGAMVTESVSGTAAGLFANTSGTEAGLAYNYASRALVASDPLVAGFHNAFVRRQLGRGPALGRDARWSVALRPAELGIAARSAAPLRIELQRTYFTYEGRDFVLLHYRVPAFSYDAMGRQVVQWGEGAALTDPGFGTMYWNAALHRAVGSEAGTSGRPYRQVKSLIALDAAGRPMVDPRAIPQTAALAERLYGTAATEVLGFVAGPTPDHTPLLMASALDIMALSIAEDSPNQLGEVTSQATLGNTGSLATVPVSTGVQATQAADAMGAQAFANGNQVAAPTDPSSTLAVQEQAHTLQGGTPPPPPPPSSTSQPQPQVVGGSRGGDGAGSPAISPETMQRMQSLASSELFANPEIVQAVADAAAGRPPASPQHAQIIQIMSDADTTIQEMVPQIDAVMQATFSDGGGGAAGGADGGGAGGGAGGGGPLDGAMNLLTQGGGGGPTAEQQSTAATQLGYIDKGVATLNALGADRETVLLFQEIENFSAQNQLLAHQLKAAMQRQEQYLQIIEDIAKDGNGTLDPAQWHLFQVNAQNIKALEAEVEASGRTAARFAATLDDMPANKLGQMMEAFGDSPAGGALSTFSHLMNVQATVGALGNIADGATRDLGSGDLPLSRPYDASTPMVLGLDLLGIYANLASGDVGAAISDATALTTTSVADLFVSIKGVRDINRTEREATETGTDLAVRQGDQYEIRRRAAQEAYEAELARIDAEIAALDRLPSAQELSRQRLAELRARRELQAQLQAAAEAEALAMAQAEEAAAVPPWTSEPSEEEWDQFREDIAEAMRPDYPTLSQEERNRISAEAARRREEERAAQLAAEAEQAASLAMEIARVAAEREQQRREMERISQEAIARREQERLDREAWLEEARNRGLDISQFDIEPVEFEGPEWEPPVWEPPVWVPPQFDAPEITPIDWTNFDDDDYPDTGNLAFAFEGMSGTVATDLSRWAEWLATQDVRRLERLALLAGYPNLASALADAENIIRQSQDDGYRRWAMQAPSCGGYVGCGPSYLERWHMKTSIVALGDILAQSREIFSSGGFSDVGITGSRLSYLLRDHGAQDGDIVQILIQQFGRTVYEGRLTLTNAGDRFDQLLRSGVASLTILAENEGTASPNTAQIRLDNVASGEAVQTYNLNTGQTATLRIATNATGNSTGGN